MEDMSRSPIITNPSALRELENIDLARPVGMLNLLKFRPQALYEPNSTELPCSGVEAMARYAQGVGPILREMNAQVILDGVSWLIGDSGEWDRAAVVWYMRGADIVDLGKDPRYLSFVHHRTAALSDSRLLMMVFPDNPALS